MEEEIKEKLEEIYNFKIEVKFIDFRQYEILGIIEQGKEINIKILYDCRFTIEGNISVIVRKIDNEIIKLYRREIK